MSEPGMDWKPRRVSITADGPTARVVLDDVDISSHLKGYTVEHRPGEHPVVVLYARPSAGTVFEGMAQVAVGQPGDPAEAIAAFLASVDAKSLENAALNRGDLDTNRYGLTRAMLAQLVDWAQGQT
ncbi:hypothetical protein [Streptomyces sp. NPDC059076]|uniref:hypothetical protein n=1 Tax=unclassified Streptomyces TaxID=2593676 RepID=UPI0036835E52